MSTTKQEKQKLKAVATIKTFNKTTQQYEPVIFPNGIVVDMNSDDFRRGITITPGSAPSNTSNRLYNDGGTLKFAGETLGGGGGSTLTVEGSEGTTARNVEEITFANSTIVEGSSGEITITGESGGADKGNGYLLYPGASTPSDLTSYRKLAVDTDAGLQGGESGTDYTIKAKLSTNGGLEFGSSGGLEVDVTDFIDTGAGLTESSNSIQVNLKTNSGLGFDASTGGIEIDVTDFIDTGAGLTESSNVIQVNLHTDGGLAFDASSGGVKVKTGNGISLDSSGNVINDVTDENIFLSQQVYGG